mmetsp:Transcript_7737/g.19731  ORF Transcript_7737/g.19731 Transcript_7737/m.19731 type:complete len:244 (+) Transcript_7737:297-1028(+)
MSSSTTCGALVDGSGSLASLRICGVIGSPSSAPAVPMKKSTSGSSSPASLALSRAARATASVAASTPFLPAASGTRPRDVRARVVSVQAIQVSGRLLPLCRARTPRRPVPSPPPPGKPHAASPAHGAWHGWLARSFARARRRRRAVARRPGAPSSRPSASTTSEVLSFKPSGPSLRSTTGGRGQGKLTPSGSEPTAPRAAPFTVLPSASIVTRVGIPSTPKWRERAAPRLSPGGIASQGISPK